MESAAALLCLLLCTLHLTAGAPAKPRYVVLFPSVLYYPYPGKVHIHLMDLDEPVRVTLHLASSHSIPNITLEAQGSDILQLNWPRFSNISTPPAEIHEVAHLHVSIQGGSLQVSEEKEVLVKAPELGTFVQTDKNVYKPGQTVKFRIVRLDQNFIPNNRELPLVAVQDPSGNRVAEWREVSPRQGIVDLSFPLVAETALGTYIIEVEGKRHYFSVKDYGAPHFEGLIRLPRVVTVKDEKIPLHVCGRYPSGRTFRGRAEGMLCHDYDYIFQEGSERICAEFKGQTRRNGCFSTKVPLASFNLTSFYQAQLYAHALLLEEGTGMWRLANKSCMFVSETAKITFENNDEFYKSGIPYTGTMLLKGTNISALMGKEFLLVVNTGRGTQRKTLRMDGSGRASFQLDTSGWTEGVFLRGELKDDPPALEHKGKKYLEHPMASLYPFSLSSNCESLLRIRKVEKKLHCSQPQTLWVDYMFDEKAVGIKLQSTDVVFLVLAKGTIVTVLRKELPAGAGLRGSFSLELPIGPELAPKAKVLGYAVLPNGEMVAHSIELNVAKCFPNKVNLSFSEQRALVGSRLRLKVQAAPGSLCAIYTVDQRMWSSGLKDKLKPSTVFNLFPVFSEDRYPFEVEKSNSPRCWINRFKDEVAMAPPINCYDAPGSRLKDCFRILWRREVLEPVIQPDSDSLVQNADLKTVTNTQLGSAPSIQSQRFSYSQGAGTEKDVMEEDTGMQMDFFATWLWELVPVGEGGSAEMAVTVPDAITKWEARMFCMSPLGLGMAPATTLTAFKPFLVELALPYGVVHHEAFTLVATVVNYLRQCLQVQVMLAESAELEVLADMGKGAYRGCVCADEERTFQWSVRATSLGEVNVTVVAKALHTKKLCGTEVPVVPAQGHVDTETKLLRVQPPELMNYVVTSPAVFYHPHTAMLWVHLSGLHEPVQVTIQLQRADGTHNITLLERKVQEPHLYLNVTFPAPAPAKGKEEIVDLHVSIQGDSLDVSEKKKVMLRALEPGIFIQTDKAVYKPGQQVKFRIVSLDKDFAPSDKKLPLVILKDPSQNRIAQWRKVSPRQGIVDLSLPLAAEPALGTYIIEVEGKRHYFSVEEYVLPKFEVTIDLPTVVLEKDKKIQVEICGRYTYGKPVQGKVQASLCQHIGIWYSPFVQTQSCIEVSGQTEKNGCFSTEVLLAAFNLTSFMYGKKFQVQASLVEDGTGLEQKNTKSCEILPEIFTVTFENNDDFYKPGIPYTGTPNLGHLPFHLQMLLTRADGAVMPQKQLLLIVHQQGKDKSQTFLTDRSGRVFFELETSGWSGMVTLHAQVNETAHSQNDGTYQDAYAYLSPFFSASRSFLQIHRLESELPCGQPQQLWVDYIFIKKALGTETENLDVVFLVLAKGTIVTILRKELPAGAGLRGSFSLELPIGPELAPKAKVLGYTVLPNGEMVAHSIELNVAKCFPNKVKMAFSEDRALPGSALRLEMVAAPGSLCAVRAVDRSVLLLKPEAELNTEVPCDYLLLGWGYSSCCVSDMDNLFSFSQNAALKLFTNANTSDVCKKTFGMPGIVGLQGPRVALHSQDHHLRIETHAREVTGHSGIPVPVQEEQPAPRTYFPETWLWDLVPVGEGGSAEMAVTVPDAITKWEAGMFCMSPLGLGMAPATTLTAFKPFFVELALPYAVVRHEVFTLVATVFNYLRQCLRVQVTLAESAELEVSASADEVYSGCICADEARTFRWGVRATNLGQVNITVSTEALSSKELCGNEMPVVPAQGRVDTVIKPLLVQPGGILVEKAHNSLLCQEADEEISLEIPANILEGSQRAHVTVMGDILGNALQNLDSLLAMPYGCGEQNMVRFAPNIYIQQYLEKSGQLRPDIRAKAQGFLQSGYQRELLYKHDDGSYSAFGKSDSSGNTWLTAFVLKSFGQARAYVAIEERHITDALRWLQKQQQKTGCFRSVGKLFNNALQGGISDELSLSAYVTAAMLELGLSPTDPMVSSALRCLEVSAADDPYTQALLAYVFGLAGRGEQQQAQLQSLAQHSVSAEGQLSWRRQGKALPSSQPSWAAAAPAEVEMTAYVLLAYLSQPQVSSDNLGTASQIVRWLSRQQNPYGGFASTQDTVVALQALAKYAALTYSSNGDFTVTVTSPAGTAQDFVLLNSTRLVLQRAALQELPGTYRVQARGQGCALVQATLRYNVPPPPSTGTFDLHVETEPRECRGDASTRFRLLLRARYTGERPTTNMVVIEAKLPSGYIPEKSSVVELKRQELVKKVEVQPDQVTIYLDQLTKEEKTFAFTATQDFPVRNLQPAAVTLYDYYETGDRTDAAYSAPCSSEADGEQQENF
ncbi:alpha-2-macroglobulin-like protein 1 [Chroicocephalus ridibundus]|uniref:alpha-2-macroglobulin-like protein 1 n=1 Tax=Chroicocephalus ridibundus TaxID=1192867 RepID=UPI002FDEC48F